MNTPSHMLIGAAVLARPLRPATLIAALAGGLVPDLPMFGMIFWATRIGGVAKREVFGDLYFSDAWQTVFSVDHGFLVWAAALGLALWSGRAAARAFAGASLCHAAADFLTHNDDARRQFWPLTDWVFRSPVSYWDRRFYGDAFAVFEVSLAAALAVLLCWRMRRLWQRLLVLAVAAPLILPFLLTGSLHGLHGLG